MNCRQFCVLAEGSSFLSPWTKSAVLLLPLDRIVPCGGAEQCNAVEAGLGSPVIPTAF